MSSWTNKQLLTNKWDLIVSIFEYSVLLNLDTLGYTHNKSKCISSIRLKLLPKQKITSNHSLQCMRFILNGFFFNKTMWRLTRQDEFPHNSPPQRWGFVGNTIARVFWGGYYAVSYWPKSNKSYSQVSMIFFVEISLR